MTRLAIVYHSAFGHTEKVAESVAAGAREAGAEAVLFRADSLDAAAWHDLDHADALIFGSPTYMGSVTAPFKAFMDGTSRHWIGQAWKDKIAAGFINAGSVGGDNLNALYQLMLFAMQHSMIWVGAGIMPGKSGDEWVNRLGGFAGLLTQSDNDSPEVTPPSGDLETARLFGRRVALLTARFVHGG